MGATPEYARDFFIDAVPPNPPIGVIRLYATGDQLDAIDSNGNSVFGNNITLQTNGSANANQLLLNIVGSSGITAVNSGGAVTLSSSGQSGLRTTTTITTAQLLALATPIVLVAAPGSGFMIDVRGVTVQYKAGATPYSITMSSTIGIIYHGQAATACIASIPQTGTIDQAASQITTTAEAFLGATGPFAQSVVSNASVDIRASANPTLGNGSLIVTVDYAVIPLS